MVYQQKLVAVIKHNNKILREKDNNTVYLPFLAEYEIFMKNLESRDVIINISIDGEDILDNQQLVIKAGQNCSLEGFMKGNKVTNKFKFIQKTGKIQNYRGDRIDDGLIRIEYRYTKINQPTTIIHKHYHHDSHWYHPPMCDCKVCRSYIPRPVQQPYIQPWFVTQHETYVGGSGGGSHSYNSSEAGGGGAQSSSPDFLRSIVSTNAFMPQFDNPAEAEAITVKGSESNQRLEEVQVSSVEDQSYTIILKLSGYDDKTDQLVEKPVLVKAKVKCSTCGKQSKSHIKYCPDCGTFLG